MDFKLPFGVNISFGNGSSNGKYVTQEHCHQAQDAIRSHLDKCLTDLKVDLKDMKADINTRFEDLKDFSLRRRD